MVGNSSLKWRESVRAGCSSTRRREALGVWRCPPSICRWWRPTSPWRRQYANSPRHGRSPDRSVLLQRAHYVGQQHLTERRDLCVLGSALHVNDPPVVQRGEQCSEFYHGADQLTCAIGDECGA